MQQVISAGTRKLNLTATQTIPGAGTLVGVWVSSASATPTIKLADGKATIANTFTPAGPNFYPIPVNFVGGLTVTISGTVDCTVIYA